MTRWRTSDQVNSLMGELQSVEAERAQNQEAMLRALNDSYDASNFSALKAEGDALDQRAASLVREIVHLVASTSAVPVVYPSLHRDPAVQGPDIALP